MSDSEVRTPITVLIVDDHALMLQGIVGVLANEPDIRVVAQAHDGLTGFEQFQACRPDITLMDVKMPRVDGLEGLRLILQAEPCARVVMLTTFEGDVQAHRALKTGARGYLLKANLHRELPDVIRRVHAGSRQLSAQIAIDLVHNADAMLSPREIEVLELVAAGQSNKEVARALRITEDTAKMHLKRIMLKLDARDRTHAVTIGLRRGFIENP
jgi:DNA-binding NarL/FixJ family response regulator